jgi:two-component sensor histidine kinase
MPYAILLPYGAAQFATGVGLWRHLLVRKLPRYLDRLALIRRISIEHVSWRAGVALSFAAAGLSFLLHLALEPFFHPDRGLIVFIPAIVLATLMAGPRFGALTAAISGIAVSYDALFVGDFRLSHADATDICMYIASSTIAIVLVHWLRESLTQERLLRKELQHRTKNLLAIIHSLVYQTLRGDAAMEEGRNAFIARLSALSRANDAIGEGGLDRVDLAFLVRSALKSFSDRFECHGDEAYISPQIARNVSLVLHELATNSTKYGAFSVPLGIVHVSWQAVNRVGLLNFVWQECGGPPVSPPAQTGFGSKLLSTLFDKGDVQFARDGLVYRVEIPLGVLPTTRQGCASPHSLIS